MENSKRKIVLLNAVFASLVWFIVDFNTIEYTSILNPIVRLIIFVIIGFLILNLKDKYKNVLKLNLSLTGAGIFFIIISIIFMLIRSIQVEIDTYRVRKTGDVDGSLF